jgi:hypothetical protein
MAILIYLLVGLVICSLVWWVITQLALPQPIRVVAVVVMAIVAIFFLLELVGPMPHLLR